MKSDWSDGRLDELSTTHVCRFCLPLGGGLTATTMTVVGIQRQSKVRPDNTVVDVATLQANYDRLWLHIRIVYVLLVVLAACYLATAFTVFNASRHFFASPATTTLDSRVSWQNLSSMPQTGRPTRDSLAVRRRRRSTSRRHRLGDDRDLDRLTRRLRSARASDSGPASSPWVNHDDDFKHDGLWMTMHSKIPVKLHCLVG